MPPRPHLEFEHIPPHALPVRNINKLKFLVIAFLVSTLFTFVLAFALKLSGIPITVILPTSAPIWIGITTITYMVQTENSQ